MLIHFIHVIRVIHFIVIPAHSFWIYTSWESHQRCSSRITQAQARQEARLAGVIQELTKTRTWTCHLRNIFSILFKDFGDFCRFLYCFHCFHCFHGFPLRSKTVHGRARSCCRCRCCRRCRRVNTARRGAENSAAAQRCLAPPGRHRDIVSICLVPFPKLPGPPGPDGPVQLTGSFNCYF